MGRATALELATDWIAHAAIGHQAQAASSDAPELRPTPDNRDADGSWETAWIDLGGEG